MMKKFLPIFLLFLCSLELSGEPKTPGRVHISFDLHKIRRIASNQLAIWVEDENGKYQDTVFVTRFTATGGYRKRPEALPEWVDSVSWTDLQKKDVDALSSPTQQQGRKQIMWDCIDYNGKPLSPGKYLMKIESNISWANRVLWQCTFEVGTRRNRGEAEVYYIPSDAASMEQPIENINVIFVPE